MEQKQEFILFLSVLKEIYFHNSQSYLKNFCSKFVVLLILFLFQIERTQNSFYFLFHFCSSQESTVCLLDMIDKACPHILEKLILHLPPAEKVYYLSILFPAVVE